MSRRRMNVQRGAAILTAMLIVVLVAALAASALWQQWRGIEVEAAERSRTQSAWVLTGALDWARLILSEDGRNSDADHVDEAWAVPLAPVRLSAFLAADRSYAQTDDEAQEAFLSVQIVDLQSRLNVTNLLVDGELYEPGQLAFARLFELLNLPAAELAMMTEQWRLAQNTGAGNGAEPAAPSAAAAPLLPQTIDQLAWLGVSPQTIARLRPFVTILPVRTPVNLNTASAEVIYACVEAFDLADAHRLVTARSTTHLEVLNDAGQLSGNAQASFTEGLHSVNSRFFEVRGQLRDGQTMVQEVSVVRRDGLDVNPLWRRRGAVPVAPTYND